MGCWLCNPLCGRCKPPWRKCICPECGQAVLVEKKKYLAADHINCDSCGADVTDVIYVEPVKCGFSGWWCAYPCGKSKRDYSEEHGRCTFNTPIKASPIAMARFDFSKMNA